MASETAQAKQSCLVFPESARILIDPYTPGAAQMMGKKQRRPFVTLTYAQSLDSALSLAPGERTALSGPETKAMTHYLRSAHDAILVGAGTAVADDPALNCRLESALGNVEKQPRPVVLDPSGRWGVDNSECLKQAAAGNGKAPWILTTKLPSNTVSVDLRYIALPSAGKVDGRDMFPWPSILDKLYQLGIKSLMVEGGGAVINSILDENASHLVDAVIITIAPIWLGQGGVLVNPKRYVHTCPVSRLEGAKWHQFGDDVVLCGRLAQT